MQLPNQINTLVGNNARFKHAMDFNNLAATATKLYALYILESIHFVYKNIYVATHLLTNLLLAVNVKRINNTFLRTFLKINHIRIKNCDSFNFHDVL